MTKNNIEEKLRQREERRKHSIIADMIQDEPKEPERSSPNTNEANPNTHTNISVIPPNREVRKRRKQVLLQKSIHDRAEKKCKDMNISMNEAINQLLDGWSKE